MRKTLVLSLALLLLAGVASAQTYGYIGIYADPMAINCNLTATIGSTMMAYVFHVGAPTRGIEFEATEPAGLMFLAFTGATGVLYIDTPPNGFAGGFSLADGSCLDSPHYYGMAIYTVIGMIDPCTIWHVGPHPVSGGPWAVDCANVQHLAGEFDATINGDASCFCGQALPSEESSWGKIKALYE
jgi:hypothetical protein